MHSSVRLLIAVVCLGLLVFSTQQATASGALECKRSIINLDDFAPFKNKTELELYLPRQFTFPPPNTKPVTRSWEKLKNAFVVRALLP